MSAPRPEDHLEIVFCVARQVARELLRVDPDELVAWGFEGLARACRTFTAAKGDFGPYAAAIVKFDILGGLRAFDGLRRVGRAGVRFERCEPGRFGGAGDQAAIERRLDVEDLLARLDPRGRHVVRERFFACRALREIGKDLGLSESRTHQLERAALERMRAGACA